MRTFIRAKQSEPVKHLLLPGLWMCLAASLNSGCGSAPENKSFARAENGRILINGKPCYFLGANLWYAPILACSSGPKAMRASPPKSNPFSSMPPGNTTTVCSTDSTICSPNSDSAACRPYSI